MTKEKARRGFATLSPERLREISSKGGKIAHEKGVAHEFKPGDPVAIRAGKKGGKASHLRKQDKHTDEEKTTCPD